MFKRRMYILIPSLILSIILLEDYGDTKTCELENDYKYEEEVK